MVYAPWLQAMNKTGAGSYVEISGGLSAIVGRMTYSLGYLGMQADPVAAGFWPSGGAFLGGPTAAVAFSI
jgi:hypothetical protein